MKSLLKRKQCKQCGESLKLFDKTYFCDYKCYSLNKKIKDEYEELSRKRVKQS